MSFKSDWEVLSNTLASDLRAGETLMSKVSRKETRCSKLLSDETWPTQVHRKQVQEKLPVGYVFLLNLLKAVRLVLEGRASDSRVLVTVQFTA